jgi:hypothetical protein
MNREELDLLKIKFYELFPEEKGLSYTDVSDDIQKKLQIILPDEFKKICLFFRGNNGPLFGSLYSFDPKDADWNICDETLRLRQSINLPNNLVILAEPDESVILMEIANGSEVTSKVYWLGTGDAYNLAEGKPLEDNPIIFPTFTDFFSYLLDEEEKRRTEESK